MVCRAVSGSYANIAIPTSEWPFLPDCLIVLVGQAGGSKPHLASGEKKQKTKKTSTHLHSVWECWGRVAASDIFHSQSCTSPLGRFQKFELGSRASLCCYCV